MKRILITIFTISFFISCNTKKKKESVEIKQNKTKTEQKTKQTPKEEINGELFKVKLFHPETETEYDSIVSREFLEDDLFTLLKFNYPKFESKPIDKNLIELTSGDMKIVIQTAEFEKEKRKLEFDSSETFLERIDGKKIYGTDGNIPRNEIFDFYLINNKEKIQVPKSFYSDLFEPTIECLNDNDDLYCYTVGYLNENGEIIVTMQNSDGAGSYMVIFLFNNEGKIKDRIIGYQF